MESSEMKKGELAEKEEEGGQKEVEEGLLSKPAYGTETASEGSDDHGNSQILGLVLKCEVCGERYVHEFKNPIATRCTHCDSVFDGRLQIVKAARKDFQAIIDRF
jgi:hypothetical protein